jgi:oxygen-independent coproporphyrinogen-3 oxidase
MSTAGAGSPVVHRSACSPRAAYVHIPFCRHRCGYCNFTVVAGRDDLATPYLQAIGRELSWLGQPRPVRTLFCGGGTPTHLPLPELTQLFQLLREWFELAGDGEFTVEANPEDIEPEKVALLREAGVNRVSLGVQSFDAGKLAVLERGHRAPEVRTAFERLRPTVPSLAMDLMFGVPGESLDTWRRDLEAALTLAPDHISTYGLTWERGTRYWGRRTRGELQAVEDEVEAQMYERAIDILSAAGYEHYEVSNFARSGHRSRHNLTYWRGGEYYGIGPGAARHVAGRRETNHRSTTAYLQRVLSGRSPTAESESLGPEDRARERLVFGLRLLEGVDCRALQQETGFAVSQLAGEHLPRLIQGGLLEYQGERLRLTRRGLLVSDSLWPYFLRV